MDLTYDLKDSIRTVLEQWDYIFDKKSENPHKLATQYFYALSRMILPVPRTVYLSAEIRETLRNLNGGWASHVDVIRRHFEEGQSVRKFLSEKAQDTAFNDRLFNDYGIHHFHLEDRMHRRKPHLVARSDYLLFAMVAESDVYFVDVARHPRDAVADDYGWARQELLQIINVNWPSLLKPFEMPGIEGAVLPDEQKKVLRQRNTNLAAKVGDTVVLPPGGGVTCAGTNFKCQFLASKLLREVEECQRHLVRQPNEIRDALEREGKSITGDMEFKLVHINNLRNVPIEVTSQLYAPHGNLGGSGFAIIETTTNTPINLTFVD